MSRQKNKKEAIRTLIELDYTDNSEIENFVDSTGFFSLKLEELNQKFENSRPTVIGIKEFENNSQNVSPKTREITILFSEPLNGLNTGTDYGDLGKDSFPKVTNRKWNSDNKSWKLEVELEPNKKYQIFITNNFRTKDRIPLKPYLISFRTGRK